MVTAAADARRTFTLPEGWAPFEQSLRAARGPVNLFLADDVSYAELVALIDRCVSSGRKVQLSSGKN